ncbi:HBL/NHE enterotoxin family protein [Aliiroseovarius sp. KMU-50]|uniref:HBL/NHE enterotoxin family protein n=1 Tax=Aliiroseovarius salicola TaxID=3009082 RepID=A0ABT4W6N0_9RHOB|nr:HBL/NHE enterotoxin family protein [Aliiroseovarius sp. KMU-50]MDA5095582.1 HBL/NHE enterotoxin family protein [Aliiroseovarius sp. KMU-50]
MNIVLLANNTSTAQQASNANIATAGQASIVQGYAMTVQRQPFVDFGDFKNLKTFETDINNGIKSAQSHASNYLDNILPEMIQQNSNIKAYFNLQNALGTALDPSAPASQAIALMKQVQEQTQGYQTSAKGLVTNLNTLRNNLNTDSSNFSGYVTKLNAAVDGDNGVLAQLDKQVDDIDTKIDTAIAGAALSGLTIAGGGLMIAVGGIADFVTAGASTPLVVAGVAVVAVGVAGAAASGIAIGVLLDQKGKVLTEKANLKAEVKLARGMSGGFDSLAKKAGGAADAAQDMANAWTSLEQDMGSLIGQLENGETDVKSLRNLYQAAAKGTVKDIQNDTNVIQQQLAGVNKKYAPDGTSIGTYVQDQMKAAA